MSTTKEQPFYTAPDGELQQGDIFRIDVVAPAADEVQRVFRAEDGRHGSVVFEEQCPGRIFSRTELGDLLSRTTRTELHTDPFCRTSDEQEEMVVVYARLFEYFVIASQTCDISGMDKPAQLWATILPVVTLAAMCRQESIPMGPQEALRTIDSVVREHCPNSEQLERASDADYGMTIRLLVDEWLNSAAAKESKILSRRIKNFLNDYHKAGYMHPLRDNIQLRVPESYVDFTAAFSVPRSKLLALRNHRIATIASPYREDFSHRFATFYSRVALPAPMRPDAVT